MPGCGKTTYLAYLAYIMHLNSVRTFCNVPIAYTIPFKKDDIGIYDMSESVILLDEAGLIYDNRRYKAGDNFSEESLSFLKLLRHYKTSVVLVSQSNDIDIKWIRMSKNIFLLRRSIIPEFTSIYRVKRTFDVNPDTKKLEDFYEKESGFLKRIFHKRFYRKPYYKYFDSWSAPALPEMPNLEEYEFDVCKKINQGRTKSLRTAVDRLSRLLHRRSRSVD